MRNRSTLWPVVALALVLTVLPVLAACGRSGATTTTSRQSATLPPGETLYLVSSASARSGSAGQRLIAMQPASATPAALLTLPAGLISPDHRALFAASPAGSGDTTIARIDPQTGAMERSLTLPGRYTTSGEGWGDATLSADGRWLALEQSNVSGASTVITLIDTQAMAAVRTFTLAGAFTLDAAAPGGRMLYLLQTLNDTAHHYYVRAFDSQAGQLTPGYIVDKSELYATWSMAGYAVARQEASDGSVDYTLYIAPGLNQAFIHALPVSTDASGGGFAHCIELPVGSSPDLLRYYTLVMAPDGSALYAANAALGVVATISLNGDSSNIFQDAVTATAHFTPDGAGSTDATGSYAQQPSQHPLENGAALSTDGKTLYVAGPSGVHVFDARTLEARGTFLAGHAITSVAASGDGHMLYAVDPAAGVSVIDLASGRTVRTARCPMQAPWGIAWVRA